MAARTQRPRLCAAVYFLVLPQRALPSVPLPQVVMICTRGGRNVAPIELHEDGVFKQNTERHIAEAGSEEAGSEACSEACSEASLRRITGEEDLSVVRNLVLTVDTNEIQVMLRAAIGQLLLPSSLRGDAVATFCRALLPFDAMCNQAPSFYLRFCWLFASLMLKFSLRLVSLH